MLDFILNHIDVAIFLILVVIGLVAFIIRKGNLQKVLVYICLRAEKNFGSKTGAVKLKCVYDWFVNKYPVLSLLISFDEFSKMVDKALEEMRHLIDTNMQIFDYVNGEEKENG